MSVISNMLNIQQNSIMEEENRTPSEVIYKEKDVLGLDEPKAGFTKPSKPNRLYIGIVL